MDKAIFAAVAFLLFFSASAVADARCDVNPYNPAIGLEDCGVDHLNPDDDSVIAEYSSMGDFYTNAFPANLNEGDRIKYRVYIKNNLGVPALNNFISCGFWQADTVNEVHLKSSPYSANPSRLTLEAGETSHIDILIEIDNIIKLRGADSTSTSCGAYNEAVVNFATGSASGFALEATGQEIEIRDVELPADNCPTGVCRNIGETIEIKYKIKNWSAVPLGQFGFAGSIFFRRPLSTGSLIESCEFEEGNVAGEGEDFLAAEGLAGDEKTLNCPHTISFLEGISLIVAQASVVGGQTQVLKEYTVLGDAYHFVDISPISIYNNITGQLSVEYDIEPEAGTLPMQIFFVAEVQDKVGDPWNKVSEWDYFWSSPGKVEQTLVGYNLEDALIPGRKKIRIMAFDGIPPEPLPNPPLFFAPNLLDWVTTEFAVPRMLQPDDMPFFPAGNTFNLVPGEFRLGIRNLSELSYLEPPGSVSYILSLEEGNPVDLTNISIRIRDESDLTGATWQAFGPYPNWSDVTAAGRNLFQFSKVWDDDSFGNVANYGGIAPGLNAEITMTIVVSDIFKFSLQAQDDDLRTALDETQLNEELSGKRSPASITKLTVVSPVKVGEETTIHIEISETRTPTVRIFDAVTGQEELGAVVTVPVAAQSQDVYYTTSRKGNFRVVAEIMQPCTVCKKSKILSVVQEQRQAVPETSLLAVAIVALSVVAITAFAGRKK